MSQFERNKQAWEKMGERIERLEAEKQELLAACKLSVAVLTAFPCVRKMVLRAVEKAEATDGRTQ